MDRQRIITQIKWGLGNQLFQFTNGYALARRLQLPLDLDITWFGNEAKLETPRKLNITKIVPSKLYRHTILRSPRTEIIDKALRALTARKKGPYRFGLPVWPSPSMPTNRFSDIEAPVCLTGVNANYKNFESAWGDISAEIRSCLSKHTPPSINRKKSNYGFVHVRRGDLITDPNANTKMRLLDANFYKEAMRSVERVAGRQRWIVCSDDPTAAETLVPDTFFAEGSSGKTEIEDLAIMSNARCGVIANSTLSLYAALLCDTGATTIAAPIFWTNTGQWGPKGRDRPEFPKHWLLT